MDQNREPEPGDLIEISRGLYQHWAIYVGHRDIIHLVKDSEHSDAGATVKRERLEDVAGDDRYHINNRLDKRNEPRPIDDILQDAESSVGREFTYNVATSNCEHFVMLLRYGKPQSQQGRNGRICFIVTCFAAVAVFVFLVQRILNKIRESESINVKMGSEAIKADL